MAHHIETTIRVNAPAEKVWETLRDFSSVERFSSNVESSPIDGATSDASFSVDFVVKYGPVGWLMGALMMKPMMRGVTRDILKGLAFHVTTGNTIGSEMPSAAALAAAVG